MARKLSLFALAVGSALLLLAAFVGGRATEGLATALVAAFPVLLIALGAADRRGGVGRLWPWLAALVVLLEGSLLGALFLSTESGRGWSFGGLPAATALFLYLAGLAALVLTGVAYAVTFPESKDGWKDGDP